MTPIAATILDVIALLQKINTPPSICYVAIDLGNVFFSSIIVSYKHRSSLLSASKASNISSLSYWGGMSTFQPYAIIWFMQAFHEMSQSWITLLIMSGLDLVSQVQEVPTTLGIRASLSVPELQREAQ